MVMDDYNRHMLTHKEVTQFPDKDNFIKKQYMKRLQRMNYISYLLRWKPFW